MLGEHSSVNKSRDAFSGTSENSAVGETNQEILVKCLTTEPVMGRK